MKKGEILDLTGQKFNMLTAIKYVGRDKQGKALWLFRCDCGKEIIKRGSNIKSCTQISCGCSKSHSWEKQLKNGNLGFCAPSHNMSKTRLYSIWHGMKRRCIQGNSSDPQNMKHYVGIFYCEEWEHFEPFHKWSMDNGYDDALTLDRIDNKKGYSPDNCRWVTPHAQSLNRTNNRYIEYDNQCLTITRWCNTYNLDRRGFYKLKEKGFSDSESLKILFDKKNKSASL